MELTNNLNGKVLYPVIDFNLIVNTDMGLIRLIREKFRDSRAFRLEILDKSDREILSLLYSRTSWNPLSIISTEENMDDIDDLYNSFFKELKKDIIDRSISDINIIDFVELIISKGSNFGISGCISVADDFEEGQIYNHFKRCNIIRKNNRSEIISKDPFYVRDYRFFKGIEDKISGKKIYMSPMNYSLEYFKSVESNLTRNNELILVGKDYRSEVQKYG